ncbi:fused DSP-PTPase phosphatase/NAD kinase-like protein [Clostridium kluyveri]|uniref:Phosphatase n=1 Tax=Clostridium kluyveri TaxID=1534 RepID=A0A1L5F4Q3_CLOKL|nr:dual specificity protein phosphatase family protein [Clostridium kluyveri]APM37985.1 phosphatase [Clostridium kluyveri]UZQ52005.1 dual specificity protein phosphatase family protein [Clostridium kluyveri]
MKKKFSIFMLIIFAVSFMAMSVVYSRGIFSSQNEDEQLRIDSKREDEMPKRFRKTTDTIKEDDDLPNLTGFSSLNESGSAQFTTKNIGLMKKAIGNMPIFIIDLREESHGFINHFAVSWLGEDGKNKGNKGLTKEEVLKNEAKRLNSIKLKEPITIKNKEIIPTKVQSEKELVEKNKMFYVRIPVTDNERPGDEMVDYFIKLVKKLPKDGWVHFHCKAGIGRTTTFMVMYDIMKNGKQVSLEDIMERQVLIGGKNLLKPSYKPGSYSSERSEFIKDFYEYVKENKDGFNTNWSQWVKDKREVGVLDWNIKIA